MVIVGPPVPCRDYDRRYHLRPGTVIQAYRKLTLFGSQMADYNTGEITLAKAVLPSLRRGMLCLADRQFFGFQLWNQARSTGADLLWRVKGNMRLTCEKRLPDGSYLSCIYPSERDWRHKTNGVVVRVIDYRLEGVADAEPVSR